MLRCSLPSTGSCAAQAPTNRPPTRAVQARFSPRSTSGFRNRAITVSRVGGATFG
jgi:hypothetical protein